MRGNTIHNVYSVAVYMDNSRHVVVDKNFILLDDPAFWRDFGGYQVTYSYPHRRLEPKESQPSCVPLRCSTSSTYCLGVTSSSTYNFDLSAQPRREPTALRVK